MQTAVVLGTFDGLHKGHLAVLNMPENYTKIALIFKIPPKCIKSGQIELLLTPQEKLERLKAMGFEVKALEFNDVEHLTDGDFLEYIKKEFNPSLISCGFNYRFGFEGKGDAAVLGEFCGKNGIILKVASPVKENGEVISSSLIRSKLKEGKIQEANRLLGYDYCFCAPVIKGDKRGRSLGFPTINQEYPKIKAPIKFGVYKTEVFLDNISYEGITNIGTRPTFPVDFVISETYIKNFSGDLYGKIPEIRFKEFLRSEQKFSSLEELKLQILKDIRS